MGKKNKILIDTNIVIAMLRGSKAMKNKIENTDNIFFVSEFTIMELLIGCNNIDKRQKTLEQIDFFGNLISSREVIQKAITLIKRYSVKHKLFLPDILIAATAYHYNLPLLTNNKKDFAFIREVEIV